MVGWMHRCVGGLLVTQGTSSASGGAMGSQGLYQGPGPVISCGGSKPQICRGDGPDKERSAENPRARLGRRGL